MGCLRMMSAKGYFDSIYAVRLEPGEDVMQGILNVCEKFDIGNGVIISAIGSLSGASIYDPKPVSGKPGVYGYGEPIALPSPVELISLDGIICTGEAGDKQLHIHCCLADGNGKSYAGHFKEGNTVLNTVEMVIGKIGDIAMTRKIDPRFGTPSFHPRQKDM